MKLFNRISLLLISSLVFAACERDYDAPPLNEPKYDGPAANTTIEELRAMGATVGEDAPYTIGEEKVMKAVITAMTSREISSRRFICRTKPAPSKWKWTRTACIITIP